MADLFLTRWAKLYSNQTPAEKALEPFVARLGVPYRTQHPLWGLRVFPDFALLQQRIVIEVDDLGHRRTAQRKKDAERTAKLTAAGWTVVRLTNEEALSDPLTHLTRILGPWPGLTTKLTQKD